MTAKERLKDLEKGKQIGFESSKPKKKKEKTESKRVITGTCSIGGSTCITDEQFTA